MTALTILILGGYGTFGGRLARLLATEPRLMLIIAGRSQARAARFCRDLGGTAMPIVLDRNGDLDGPLDRFRPDILVDASGPFQVYGAAPYRVVEACLARAITYLDLADSSDFVAGIAQFDAAAKAAGIAVMSGLSSFPTLTAAAVAALAEGLASIDTIAAGVAPSPFAGIGANVMRAIASYAGRPLRLVRDGRPATAFALTESRAYTIAPPGRLPLRRRRFALVDVPDLQVLPARWPTLRSIWVGAGTVPAISQQALIGLAWLVRLRLLPSLTALAPIFTRASQYVRWGERRGGMFVSVDGTDDAGQRVERSWHLIAEGDDGPFIPAMAAQAIILRRLNGGPLAPGARSGAGDVSLSDYEALFARHAIQTGRRERSASTRALPLYRRVLGPAWDRLPEPVRVLHAGPSGRVARGLAEVERGASLLARLTAWLFGFPPAGRDVPVSVTFLIAGADEVWRRDFGGRRFESQQSEGAGRWDGLLCESFGPVRVGIALVLDGERLQLVVRQWSLFGIPMPHALAPGGAVYEEAECDRFRFHVTIGHPVTGLIVRYRGWLKLEPNP